MTTGKGKKTKKTNAVAHSTKDTKETLVDNVKDGKNENKDKSIDNLKDAKNDNNDKAKVQDKNEDTKAPNRPSANNGGYSDHFDPIPAENKSKKNGTKQLSTVDISKSSLQHANYSYLPYKFFHLLLF